MKIKKKWGWSKKNNIRYYRRMFTNSYATLYNIFDDDYIWDVLYDELIFIRYRTICSMDTSFYKKNSSKKLRLKNKSEIKKLFHKKDFDEGIFYGKVNDIAYFS